MPIPGVTILGSLIYCWKLVPNGGYVADYAIEGKITLRVVAQSVTGRMIRKGTETVGKAPFGGPSDKIVRG